jgi:hypothetical protein
MSRKLIGALTAIVVLNGIAVGSTLVWPNMASSTASPPATAGAHALSNGDPAPAAAATQPPRAYIPAFLTMIDFERVVGEHALPRRDYVPVVLTAVDFEGAFASVIAARRGNTPPNREKLRNAGWERILGQG